MDVIPMFSQQPYRKYRYGRINSKVIVKSVILVSSIYHL